MIKVLNENELKIANENRSKINEKHIEELEGYKLNDCSIISSNCIGGMIYHDLGLKFKSPTINLYFSCHDFALFVNNLYYYLQLTPKEFEYEKFPILLLDDIKLFCQHYKSYRDAIETWERRKERVNYSDIYVIATDRDCNNVQDLKLIDQAPYNKTIFVSNPNLILQNGVFVPGYENQVGHLDRFIDESGYREYEKFLSLKRVFRR